MRSLCVLLITTAGALAAGSSSEVVANKTYRCGLRGFSVTLTFGPDGRTFSYRNSVGEADGPVGVTWGDGGEGRSADPEDPPFAVDPETKQFKIKGQTCVLDPAGGAGEH